jgi:hypothetical protein
MLETAAAKLATVDADGHVVKPFVVDNSPSRRQGHLRAVRSRTRRRKAGVSDTVETLFDPQTGKRRWATVLAGPQYTLKLAKQADAPGSLLGPIAVQGR